MLVQDGWRALKTSPVSRRARGVGFGELGMADYLYIRYCPQSSVSLIPGIVEAIKTAETLFPGATGPGKLNFVLGIIQDAGADIAKVLPQITSIITRIVSGLNTMGIFKHAAGTPTSDPRAGSFSPRAASAPLPVVQVVP
jgi:hypothetical protein